MKMSKSKYKLSNYIIPFENKDKSFQEEIPSPDDDLIWFPHASRIILVSPPSGGK